MATPIIIPAYNEESHIASTLRSLPREGVRPIVALNASNDQTAEIAQGFGVELVVSVEQGKLLAIQQTLKMLGKNALDPFIVLDADTKPIFPQFWAKNMVKDLHPERQMPSALGGPVIFTDGQTLEDAIRTFRRARRTLQTRGASEVGRLPQSGPNMSLFLQNSEVLDSILALPNYWPGEDQAMNQVVLDQRGEYTASLSPSILAYTPTSESYLSSRERRRLGIKNARSKVLDSYIARGPEDAIPYESPHK